MLPEDIEHRRLVRLHPHLEGKSVLFIESSFVTTSSIFWVKRCELERMTVTSMATLPEGPGGIRVPLLEYMRLNHIDGLIIHPEIRQPWLQELEEVFAKGNPVVVAQGARVEKGTSEAYQRFYELGIPVVRKGTVEFYEDVLDCLEMQFVTPRR